MKQIINQLCKLAYFNLNNMQKINIQFLAFLFGLKKDD